MIGEVVVEKVAGVWVVRIPGPNGRVQEFSCATEQMAQRLAASMCRGLAPRIPSPREPVRPAR